MINKADRRFLFVDTETGGVIPEKHNLLSIGMVIWDLDKGILDKREYFVKAKRYYVTEKAKEINKFDRNKHQLIAQEQNDIILDINNFCKMYFEEYVSIPIAGHNIQFDVNFLKIFYKKNNRSFNQLFSHRYLDTYSVFKTLVLAGKINTDLNSSADAFKYFNIKVDGRHSALGDAVATVKLYEKLLELIKE